MFGNIQPIITYTVNKNILEIVVPKRDDVNLSKIYTREYFEKFGLNVIEVKLEDHPSNMGNNQQELDSNTKKKEEDTESLSYGLTDKQEFIPNIKSEQEMEREIKEKGLEEVILGKREVTLKSGYEVLPLRKDEEGDLLKMGEKEKEQEETNETSKGVRITIKLKKGDDVIGLREYQERRKEEEEEEGEEDMERVSGLNYNEIEEIIEGINKSVNEYELLELKFL